MDRLFMTLVIALTAPSSWLNLCMASDVVIESFVITTPADPSTIEYNRVTAETITFTVTVKAASVGGEINGIDVYFADSDGDEIDGTKVAAGGNAPSSGSPQTITGNDTPVPIEGNTADMLFSSVDDCTAAKQLCALIKGGGVDQTKNEDCIDVGTESGEAGATNCQVLYIDDNKFTITNPSPSAIEYTRREDTSITFEASISPYDGYTTGVVDTVNVFFSSENADKQTTPVAAVLTGGTLPIPAPKTKMEDASVSLKLDEDCSSYTLLCVQILEGTVIEDEACIDIGPGAEQAGDIDCSVLTIDDESLKITDPLPSTITYSTTEETSITFEMTVSPATGLTGQVDKVHVYFSDKDETKTEAVAGEFEGAPLQVTSANTKLDGVVASVILDENCSKYTHLCVQILDGTVIEDEDCLATGTEEGQAGGVDCSGSSGLLNAVGRFSILIGVLVAMTTRWM